MPKVMQFYIDDSGTRHPDRRRGQVPQHNRDWFGLGGVLIKQEEEAAARKAHAEFCESWNISAPLHSSEIRGKHDAFAWLGRLQDEERQRFLEELYQLMAQLPLVGHACVIDRPGYNRRYLERYGPRRWSLCKTAFAVVVERAAKLARRQGYKLRVLVERCDRTADNKVKGYYDDLRRSGMPFDAGNSGKYAPLSAQDLSETLYELRLKHKSSPIVQLADLYLWPMCIGGYDPENWTYRRLKDDGKLVDCVVEPEELPSVGIKYSCWELVEEERAQNTEARRDAGPQGSHRTVTS